MPCSARRLFHNAARAREQEENSCIQIVVWLEKNQMVKYFSEIEGKGLSDSTPTMMEDQYLVEHMDV